MGVAYFALAQTADAIDVQRRYPQVMGQDYSAAIRALGSPRDELVDVSDARRWWVAFPIADDALHGSFFVAQIYDNKVVGLHKCKDDAWGVMDHLHELAIEKRVLGRNAHTCESELELDEPLVTLRNARTGSLVRLYDTGESNLVSGIKYCVLHYDVQDICTKVRTIGVTATRGRPTPGPYKASPAQRVGIPWSGDSDGPPRPPVGHDGSGGAALKGA
jgi:hypothetical protein